MLELVYLASKSRLNFNKKELQNTINHADFSISLLVIAVLYTIAMWWQSQIPLWYCFLLGNMHNEQFSKLCAYKWTSLCFLNSESYLAANEKWQRKGFSVQRFRAFANGMYFWPSFHGAQHVFRLILCIQCLFAQTCFAVHPKVVQSVGCSPLWFFQVFTTNLCSPHISYKLCITGCML